MASRRDDGLGCLVLLGLVGCAMVYNWVKEHPVTALLIAGAIAAVGLAIFMARAWENEELARGKQEIKNSAKLIIQKHAKTLRRRRDQTVFFGAYDEVNIDAWVKEKEHFYQNVLTFSLPAASDPSTGLKYESDYELKAFCFDVIDDVVRGEDGPVDATDIVDPIDFERWCAEQLEAQGWDARTTKGSGDQGADVIAERHGFRVVLQCKLYSKPVGNKAVQEAYAAMQFEGADLACVVTNADYTKSARLLAQQTDVLLLHRDDLLDFDAVVGNLGRPSDTEDQLAISEDDLPLEEIFAREGKRALEILSSRPAFWEYLLVEELLRSKLSLLKDEAEDVERIRARKARRRPYDFVGYLEFLNGMTKLGELTPKVTLSITNDIPAALGPSGGPGDPVALLRAVETIEAFCLEALDFETEAARIEAPEEFRGVNDAIVGIGSAAVAYFETVSQRWSTAVRGIENGSRNFAVHMILELPQLERMAEEMEKVNLVRD
jgi:restriction system protein